MQTMEVALLTGPSPASELVAIPGYARAKLLISPSNLDFRLDGSIVNTVRVDFAAINSPEEAIATHLGVAGVDGGLGIAPLPWPIRLCAGRPTLVRLPPGTVQVFDGEGVL